MTASEKPALASEREQGHGPSEQAGLWVLSFGCPLHIGAIEAGPFPTGAYALFLIHFVTSGLGS